MEAWIKSTEKIRPGGLCRYREVIRVYCWLCNFIITCILIYWFAYVHSYMFFVFLHLFYTWRVFFTKTHEKKNLLFFWSPTNLRNITEVQHLRGRKFQAPRPWVGDFWKRSDPFLMTFCLYLFGFQELQKFPIFRGKYRISDFFVGGFHSRMFGKKNCQETKACYDICKPEV